MMSIPYKGSSQRYAEGSPVFDLARTPSAVGIVSEVFRRRPDVHRSASPLHPVLAAGPLAAWLTSDHDVLPHSCGPGTPFERFLNLDGVFVFLDAPFSSLTFMHYVEHLHRHTLPAGLYHAEAAVVKLVDLSGHERLVRQFYFSKAARAHRSFAAVERALVEEGTMRTARVGGSRLLRVRAKDVVAAADRLVARGEALYR
jgi:aminoglycoside 3-N-acetyltransferase